MNEKDLTPTSICLRSDAPTSGQLGVPSQTTTISGQHENGCVQPPIIRATQNSCTRMSCCADLPVIWSVTVGYDWQLLLSMLAPEAELE